MKEELATKYDPSQVEGKWYDYWMRHKLFHSEPDAREPYTIVIPPPNVTCVLHMGQAMRLQKALQLDYPTQLNSMEQRHQALRDDGIGLTVFNLDTWPLSGPTELCRALGLPPS